MSDLINREKTIKEFEKYVGLSNAASDAHHMIISILRTMPSAKQETAKVENIRVDYDSGGICFQTYGDCDNCGAEVNSDDRYCHYCGMKLDWGKNEKNTE